MDRRSSPSSRCNPSQGSTEVEHVRGLKKVPVKLSRKALWVGNPRAREKAETAVEDTVAESIVDMLRTMDAPVILLAAQQADTDTALRRTCSICRLGQNPAQLL